jgi:hypothetical protein
MTDASYTEPEVDRQARLPSVLRAYKRDLEKHGRPLDSGLPEVLERAAVAIEAEALRIALIAIVTFNEAWVKREGLESGFNPDGALMQRAKAALGFPDNSFCSPRNPPHDR